MKYAICEISSKQYIVKPGQIIEVDKLSGTNKTISVDKILLLAKEGKIEIGKPYLKQSLNFEVLGTQKKPKIRIATYKAKANYRRIKGQRRQVTQIRLIEQEKKFVKKD